MIVIRGHSQHDSMLDVEHDFLLFPVISDERVKRVAIRDPTNQSTVGRQRNYGKPLDG